MNLEMKEMRLLWLFCLNRITYDKFLELKEVNDEIYFVDLWSSFIKDPIGFILSRDEKTLFENILKEIKEINYKG